MNSTSQTQNALSGDSTKFKTRWNEIERVVIQRESKDFVWIGGRRCVKRSGWENYFDSFEEAKAFLVAEAEKEVERLKGKLHRARTALGNVQSIKAPSVPDGNEKQ